MNTKMDGKKTKRRKSVGRKRHGSMEEKPKSAEVMNEKEKQDRLDAASALSSLMFLPPLSADADDDEGNVQTSSQDTPSAMISHLRSLSSLPGIPTSLGITPQLPKLGRPPKSSTVDAITAARNNAILAGLESRLKYMTGDNVVTSTSRTGVTSSRPANRTHLLSSPLPLTLPHSKIFAKQVPLTIPVIPHTHTVNQNVVKALRNAMAKNIVKTELDKTIDAKSEMSTVSVTQDIEKLDNTSSSVPLKKKDNSDTNLPLKKRRLVGMINASSSDPDSTSESVVNSGPVNSSVNLGSLATYRQLDDILQMESEQMDAQRYQISSAITVNASDHFSKPDEGYRPVQVDPRTSLMVLSDLKFALTPDEDGDLPLHIAVVHEDTALVKKFIDIMLMSGKTVDRFNKLQQTPLHLAILVNKPDIMTALLSAGANPNLLDRHGCTAIHSSVCKQFDSCMDTVLRESRLEINLNCRDYEGYFPLHTCVELDNLRMLAELVHHGADINAQDGKAGRSILMYAVEYNRCRIVRYLLENGGSAELQNYAGVTPLMIAQAGKMDELLHLLNVALDNVRVDEPQYIHQAKKVPIARVPSRTDFSESKSRRPSMNGIPLVYEEYDRSRDSPDSRPPSRPSYSRQSSTSSPIDLSMRGTSVPKPTVAPEPKGRPPRKKGKRESKNNKEKHSQKSNVIEKHASLVAALESKNTAENSSVKPSETLTRTSGNDELSEKANAFKNLFLNLHPLYAQKLFEKMNQVYGLKPIPDITQTPDAQKGHTEPDRSDKVQNNDRMQVGEKADVSEKDTNVSTTVSQTVVQDKCQDLESEQKTEHTESNSSELGTSKKNIESGVSVSNECDSSGTVPDVSADHANDETNTNISEPMDDVESPAMPVLSRATSECMDTEENAPDDLTISSAPSISSSPAPVINKVSSECDSNTKPDYTQNSDHTMDAKPETEVSSSTNESISKEPINRQENNSKIEDDHSASSENHKLVIKGTDKISVNERLIDSTANSSNSTGSPGIHSLPEHADHSEQNRQTSSFVKSTLSTPVLGNTRSTPVLGDTSGNVEEDFEAYSDHSDDSMEVELSDVMKDKISGKTTEVYNTSEIVKNKSVNSADDSELIASATDNVRNSIEEEQTLVMDIDEDCESGLVIDENVSDDGNTHNNDNKCENEELDKTGGSKVSGKSDIGEPVADSDLQASEKVVKDGINKEVPVKHGTDLPEVTKTASDELKESDGVKGLQSKSESKNVSGEIKLASDIKKDHTPIIQDGDHQKIPEKISSKPTDSSLIPSSSRPISSNLSSSGSVSSNLSSSGSVSVVDNLLKSGQSHVLYYHDGDTGKYKPVRIFIDNSEQSSKVLKQMIQSASFSTLDAAGSTSSQSDAAEPESKTAASELLVPVKGGVTIEPKSVISKPSATELSMSIKGDMTIEHAKSMETSKSVIDKKHETGKGVPHLINEGKVSISSNGLTSVTESPSSTFQNAYIQSLQSQIETDSRRNNTTNKLNTSKRKSSPGPMKPDTVLHDLHSDFKHKKTVESISDKSKTNSNFSVKTLVSSAETLTKSISSISSTANMLGRKAMHYPTPKPMGYSSLKALYSEGTLTRVNPDIKSRLSKALQSASRRSIMDGSDSDALVKRNPIETIPTIATSLDTRQQL